MAPLRAQGVAICVCLSVSSLTCCLQSTQIFIFLFQVCLRYVSGVLSSLSLLCSRRSLEYFVLFPLNCKIKLTECDQPGQGPQECVWGAGQQTQGEAGGGRGEVTISLSPDTLTSLTLPGPGGGRVTLTLAAAKHYNSSQCIIESYVCKL